MTLQDNDNLRTLLRGMLKGRVDLVDGCRELTTLHSQGEESIPRVFVGYDSELDCVPLTRLRHLWSEEALVQSMKLLDAYRDDILADCKRLLDSLQ